MRTLQIAGTPVTAATVGVAYDGFTVTSTGGSAHHLYSIAAGVLPAGLTLDATSGAVAGTPTEVGTSTGIVIRVTDSGHRTADLAAFDIDVAAAALAFADFENDAGELGGVSTPLASLLASDTDWGGGGSLSSVVAGVGLSANTNDEADGSALHFVGLDIPAGGVSAVLDWSAPTTTGQLSVILYDTVNFDTVEVVTDTHAAGSVGSQPLPQLAAGDHKLAVTIIPGVSVTASQDGGAIVSDALAAFAEPASVLMFWLFGLGASDAVLRSVTVTDVVADADLAALSAL